MLYTTKKQPSRDGRKEKKMERAALMKSEKMGQYEREQGFASYRTIVDYFVGDIVLCNNIINIDTSVYDNLPTIERYYNENDEEITEEEYYNDDNAYCDNSISDIYQFYLCNISEYDKEQCLASGLIISYSDLLECDVLCVDHFGTSWDYVLTNVKLFDNYDELEKWVKGDE